MNRWIVANFLLPMHEKIIGRRTFGYYRQLEASQWWPRERILQYQLDKLRTLVGVALEQTDAYARLAGVERSWRPKTLDALQQLPLMDKEMLRQGGDRLVNWGVDDGPRKGSTSGSTGQPLNYYMDRRRQAYDKAARMLTHHWWGVAPGAREVLIWGSPIELNKQDRIKRFRDRITNERLISSHDIGPASIAAVVDKIRRFGPTSIFGYPSSIEMLCELANDAGLSLGDIAPKAVFTTAEVLYEHQRQAISKAFGGSPIADNYGSREGGFISHQCPAGNMHIISENIIVEVIADGRPVGAGVDGEIVITHLDNLAMPFIRYRTGDVGQLSDETCSCGRGGMLMKVVQGRTNDMLVARDGRRIHGSMITYLMRNVPSVKRYQFIQESLDLTRLLLVCDGRLAPDREKQICEGVTHRIGAPTTVSIEYVEEIPIPSSGKFRYILTKLPASRQFVSEGQVA